MPSSMLTGEPTRHVVNLHMREDVRDLIDSAARAHGKSRADFMIDAARRAAEEALLDQTYIQVDAETYQQFISVLDAPAQGDGYSKLMTAPKPW
jgi:uncharacterized protein (DUF1778 family)